METTELDEANEVPTRHFILIRVVHLTSTRLDLAGTLGGHEINTRETF
jgi:hypothetical protein